MLDSIKDWFVDRLHKYMDAAREIVENNEGIRSAETYYSTVKATLKKEAALLTKTFCIGMGGILATMLCGWLAELLGHGILSRLRCGLRPGRLVVEGSRRRILCVLLPWHCPADSVQRLLCLRPAESPVCDRQDVRVQTWRKREGRAAYP